MSNLCKYHFIITRFCPFEKLFDGLMTFSDARKFMDEHACFERPVGFKVFNEKLLKWQDFKYTFHGGRRVSDGTGCIYILEPDYCNLRVFRNEDEDYV